jgi:hypothetical protein
VIGSPLALNCSLTERRVRPKDQIVVLKSTAYLIENEDDRQAEDQ